MTHNPNPYEPPLDQPYPGAPYGAALKRFVVKGVTFTGRASLAEYWKVALVLAGGFFALFLFAAVVSVMTTNPYTGQPGMLGGLLAMLAWLAAIAAIVPQLALTIRRLQDAGYAWPTVFIYLIPFAGPIILLVFLAQASNPAGAQFDAAARQGPHGAPAGYQPPTAGPAPERHPAHGGYAGATPAVPVPPVPPVPVPPASAPSGAVPAVPMPPAQAAPPVPTVPSAPPVPPVPPIPTVPQPGSHSTPQQEMPSAVPATPAVPAAPVVPTVPAAPPTSAPAGSSAPLPSASVPSASPAALIQSIPGDRLLRRRRRRPRPHPGFLPSLKMTTIST
ncbi:DUF805 domain-containing protein [Microbacterium suwonense]|uniref:DUF805 domain-containing protein n=1 Tax=Microbacterium suwonense TaxID=683047 RepID=A0ABN6X4Y0_9MICO|nr:DUF805 domain-containing protein [Microbacterium suwonense]BDZ39624.1 hypothetical protein GCM10025863_22380 [Microbacterium suwonense]